MFLKERVGTDWNVLHDALYSSTNTSNSTMCPLPKTVPSPTDRQNLSKHFPVFTIGAYPRHAAVKCCRSMIKSDDLSYWRHKFRLVQSSPFTSAVVGGTWVIIQQRSSSSLSCGRPSWAALPWRQVWELYAIRCQYASWPADSDLLGPVCWTNSFYF